MIAVKIRLTGENREAIENAQKRIVDEFQVIEKGSIRASSRAKYSGSFICYMTVIEHEKDK